MIHHHNIQHLAPTCYCPNCGCNLRQFDEFAYGNISIDRRGDLLFEGRLLHLPRSQYLMVEALIKAQGRGLTRSVLATIAGGEIYDQTVSKYIERVRSSFRRIKPGFDQISSMRGFGAYRWNYQR